MKKIKKKARRWRCQGIRFGKRCPELALIETKNKFGNTTFQFPIVLKLCPACGQYFSSITGQMK